MARKASSSSSKVSNGDAGVGIPPASPELPARVKQIDSSIDSVRAIVSGCRRNWSLFLEEDHDGAGEKQKAEIRALFELYPDK